MGRGRYALPAVAEARQVAHGMNGVLSHTSAALELGWPVLVPPTPPHVLVPKKRKVPARCRDAVHLHRKDLAPGETSGLRTSASLTLQMCVRTLPLAEALAVADSALRAGHAPNGLHQVALLAQGPGAKQARRVAAEANALAANPLESGLRAIALDVPGLRLVPQVRVRTGSGQVRPDLVDEVIGMVVEADSFRWHGDRVALKRDARRYNALVAAGWIVLRFCWEDVMFEQAMVRAVLASAVERRTTMVQPGARPA